MCRNAEDEFVYAVRVAKATCKTNMKTKLGLLFFGLAASAMASAQAPAKTVRVMLMPDETAREIKNRTGDNGQRYGGEWSKDAGELAKAGVLEGNGALMPAQTGRFLSAGRAGFAPGAYSKAPAQFGGTFKMKVREAESWARRCPSVLRGGEVELRPMMPKMGPKPGAGE